MKLPIFPCAVLGVASLAQAAELAPVSAQYQLEGTIPTTVPPVVATPAPKLFSRKVWPRVELSDGRVFEQVRVSAEDAATVTFVHTGGMAKVDKRTLPEDMAVLHPYNEGGGRTGRGTGGSEA